jgi:quercetin dioxygenase-like cupin family protein
LKAKLLSAGVTVYVPPGARPLKVNVPSASVVCVPTPAPLKETVTPLKAPPPSVFTVPLIV